MRKTVRTMMMTIAVFAIATGSLLAQDAKQEDAPKGASEELWKHMHEGGLISDEDYQHALQHGSLPSTGATPSETEKPTPSAKQRPPRERRQLSTAARRERAQAKLATFATRMREKYSAKRDDARTRAKALGMPLREDLPKGGVAALDYFDDQGFPQVNQTENAVSADTISTDEVWPAGGNGFSLTGSPVTLGVWDGGAVRTSHTEFGSRVTQQDDALSEYGLSGHATAVAGTMASAGSYYAPSRGMSYASSVHAYDWDDYLTELAISATNGVQISNHSYGYRRGWYWSSSESTWYWYGTPGISQTEDSKFGLYDAQAQERDEFVYDAVYSLPCWSAGNDRDDGPSSQPVTHKVWVGYWADSTTIRSLDGFDSGFDTIGSRKTAKNILTVGAVDDIVGGYTDSNDVDMAEFSGFGPTDDGRIKPDVVANGVGLITPASGGDYYYYYPDGISGTSFSAPSVAGSLGPLQQLHEDLHGTNQPLWASTLKGVVLHTADESGDYAGPDYRFGWGLMNTFAAAQLITNNAAYNSKPHIKEVTLPDGEQVLFQVNADTNLPLRVTLCWTDPPGPLPSQNQLDPTNSVLVNDLDLRVISPNGTTNFPWVLDPASPANAATTGDNWRDNVEQVHIDSTVTGLYTIVISHKGSLSNSVQDASILLTGNQPENVDIWITDIATASGTNSVEWSGAVGSIHTVMTSTNLMDTNGWSALSDDMSIIQELTEWTDDQSTNASDRVRFYRINEIK